MKTDNWTMIISTCNICDKDKNPLDIPDELCGHDIEHRGIARVPVIPREISDEMVERAWGAYSDPGDNATDQEEMDAMRYALEAALEVPE
jgi:hypothetical protein